MKRGRDGFRRNPAPAMNPGRPEQTELSVSAFGIVDPILSSTHPPSTVPERPKMAAMAPVTMSSMSNTALAALAPQ